MVLETASTTTTAAAATVATSPNGNTSAGPSSIVSNTSVAALLASTRALHAPSAIRSRDAIWRLVKPLLHSLFSNELQEKRPVKVLEVASGSGCHIEYF